MITSHHRNVLGSLIVTAILILPWLSLPRPSFAQSSVAIGLSPGEVEREIHQGMTVPSELYVTRSGSEGELNFTLTLSGDSIIDFHGLSKVSIPAGEPNVSVPFDLITAGLAPGEYNARANFVLDDLFADPGGSSNAIQYGITAKIHLTITAPADANTVLSAKDYPNVLESIVVSNAKVTQTRNDYGHTLHVSWDVENHGQNAVTGVRNIIIATQHGSNMQRDEMVTDKVIPAGGAVSESYDLNIPYIASGGTYNIEIQVGDSVAKLTPWVMQPQFRKQLTIVLAGLVAMIAVAGLVWFIDRRRHLKLGNHRP